MSKESFQDRDPKEPPHVEKIGLGEEFKIFDPALTVVQSYEGGRIRFFNSSRLLELPDMLYSVKLDFRSGNTYNQRGIEITPFDPELGYVITAEDLNLESRKKKIDREMGRKKISTLCIIHPQRTLDLTTRPNVIGKDGIRHYNSLPENFPTLSLLRFQVSFPDVYLESRYCHDKSGGSFDRFYPHDTGELPDVGLLIGLYNQATYGHRLILPNDPNKLAQIKGRFVLAREGSVADLMTGPTPENMPR